jgi:hypothetical protein
MPSDAATPFWMLYTPWVDSHSVRESPSHRATHPCGSMGVWISHSVR